MNSQTRISQQSLPPACVAGEPTNEPANEDQRLTKEAELWEPPFERWLRLADDLLRDWPAASSRVKRV